VTTLDAEEHGTSLTLLLSAQTVDNAWLVNHKLGKTSATLEQFCEQLHLLDQMEHNFDLFTDEVRILKCFYTFLQVRSKLAGHWHAYDSLREHGALDRSCESVLFTTKSLLWSPCIVVQSSAFLHNAHVDDLSRQLGNAEASLGVTMQNCHSVTISQLSAYQMVLRQRIEALHEDVRNIGRQLDEKNLDIQIEEKDKVLMALTQLGALKMRVQALQKQARKLVSYQEVMRERHQFVKGELTRIDNFPDVGELYQKLVAKIRMLDRMIKVKATFDKWLGKKLKEVDLNGMQDEFSVVTAGLGARDRGGANLSQALLRKMKMYLFLTKHLLNNHMSLDHWKSIQKLVLAQDRKKQGTSGEAEGVEDDNEAGKAQVLRSMLLANREQKDGSGAVVKIESIQDVIMEVTSMPGPTWMLGLPNDPLRAGIYP
jgi:hypothetical protein